MKVLAAVLVYNGAAFVPACLESLAAVSCAPGELDVLVLDDASPQPGWSEELGRLCAKHGFGYYRSPRNLGIPRNMNLALLRGLSGGYDHVLLLNSDVIVPSNLVVGMVAAAEHDEGVGSVTAWSNNVSIYSLPNSAPELLASSPGLVDWASAALDTGLGGRVEDVPVGVGFCQLVPVRAARAVGLMDPIFGRGYGEELDWCMRSHAAGLRSVLATGVFVYHEGGASTRPEGILGRRETTVAANEAIVDARWPSLKEQAAAYIASGRRDALVDEGLACLVRAAARDRGYRLEASWLGAGRDALDKVRVVVSPGGAGSHGVARAVGHFAGWRAELELPGGPVVEAVAAAIGAEPEEVRLLGRGPVADRLGAQAAASGLRLVDDRAYPERAL